MTSTRTTAADETRQRLQHVLRFAFFRMLSPVFGGNFAHHLFRMAVLLFLFVGLALAGFFIQRHQQAQKAEQLAHDLLDVQMDALPRKIEEKEPLLMRLAHAIHNPILRLCMHHKFFVVGFAACVLVVAFGMIAPHLGAEFVPRLSEGPRELRQVPGRDRLVEPPGVEEPRLVLDAGAEQAAGERGRDVLVGEPLGDDAVGREVGAGQPPERHDHADTPLALRSCRFIGRSR